MYNAGNGIHQTASKPSININRLSLAKLGKMIGKQLLFKTPVKICFNAKNVQGNGVPLITASNYYPYYHSIIVNKMKGHIMGMKRGRC